MTIVPIRQPAAEEPARISLSILEPPCRCREPLVPENLRCRREVALDLRATACCRETAPVLAGAAALRETEYLRVLTRTLSLPLLAAVQAGGYRYQVVAREKGRVEIIVWQFMSPEEKIRYLEQGVDPESIVPVTRA